ncbi:O-antigen ligase family protein [bacterium]|nr:O-antigen ligase family protein [bacterium]
MKLGLFYVLSVPYVAGLACFGGPVIGGFRLTGWVFVIMLATAPLVFLLDRTPTRFPITCWIPWVTVVFLSLGWVDEIGRWQLQDACQIATPFVIAPIASKAIKNEQDIALLLRGFNHCLLILLAATGLHFFSTVTVFVRPMALTAALVGCVFVAQVRNRPTLAIVGWLGCLLIAGLTGGRIATVALLMEWVLLPGFRRSWQKLVMGALILILAITLFYTPLFQERFFGEDNRGTLADVKSGDYISSGRFTAWPILFEEVKRRPWIGSGISSSGDLVKAVWEQATKPHNDYLRVLLEQGALGLFCLIYGVTCQLVSLRKNLTSRHDERDVIRKAAILGFFVFLIVAFTDNPIVYGVWFMHPLLALAGASYPSGAAASTRNNQPALTRLESGSH